MFVGSALFREGDLSAYLRGQEGGVDDHIREHVAQADLAKTDGEIVDALFPAAMVEPLQVDFEHPQKEVRETRVQVSDMFRGTVTIDGVRATRSFTFSGDPDLFRLRPSTWGSSLPYGEVYSRRITIGIEGRNDAEALKREIDSNENILRQYVDLSTREVSQHNEKLKGLLAAAVARRRQYLGGLNDLRNRI